MKSKSALLMFLLAGLICGATWLPADEPVPPAKIDQSADVDVNALLKRIDELESRVAKLEVRVAQSEVNRRLSAQQGQIMQSLTAPESPALKNLPPQEINGIRFYHVPLKERTK